MTTIGSVNQYVVDLVEEIGTLPSVAARVVALTSEPDCDLRELSKVILSDSVLTTRFLALANSAAVSRGNEIRDLRGALVRLGLRRVRNVALCMGMHDLMPSNEEGGSIDRLAFWEHTLATASCARELALLRGRPASDDAYLVGILHGIGLAALDQKAKEKLAQALQLARCCHSKLCDAELEIFDFHHGKLAAHMLERWHLPAVFVEAIEFYPDSYQPGDHSAEADSLIRILREAITVVRAMGVGENGDADTVEALGDLGELLGLSESALEELADGVDRDVRDMSQLLEIELDGQHLFTDALARSRGAMARMGLEGFAASLEHDRLEQELVTARSIQQRLLPRSVPRWPGYEIAALNLPSRRVSGDYYDFLTLPADRTGLVIADVSDKGMPASLLASNLQATLRALATAHDGPGAILQAANAALFESTDPERFATLFMAVLDPGQHTLRYASAGHDPPLLLHKEGATEWLPPAGTSLGMVPTMDYPERVVSLACGDILVMYTDGITEASDPAGQEFSRRGLEAVVLTNCTATAEQILTAIVAAVRQHTGIAGDESDGSPSLPDDTAASDDLTVIVLRRSA